MLTKESFNKGVEAAFELVKAKEYDLALENLKGLNEVIEECITREKDVQLMLDFVDQKMKNEKIKNLDPNSPISLRLKQLDPDFTLGDDKKKFDFKTRFTNWLFAREKEKEKEKEKEGAD